MNAQKKKFLPKLLAASLGVLAMFTPLTAVTANADGTPTEAEEIVYYDSEAIFHGYGVIEDADYYLYCDEAITESYTVHSSAPSYGNGDSSLTNACGAISGTNVVVFYDRYFPDILADFTPGMMNGAYYTYFPDLGMSQTVAALESLYSLMKIPEVGGTTSANFRSGLATFMSNRGCSASYSSFYSSSTNVNLSTLITAVNAGKVGVIMCSTYNYITSMNYADGNVYFAKTRGYTGHIMLVYGYKTVGYYTDGVKIAEKTFLFVSSGYSSGTQGFMELNDFSDIDEAWIVNVS